MKKVAIIGLGYVGSAMSRMFDGRFEIARYDTNGYDEYIGGADLAIICVPTPSKPDGSCDIGIVEEAVAGSDAKLILIKSTVAPGTTDMLAARHGKLVHFSPEYIGEPTTYVRPWRYLDPREPVSHDFVIVGGPRANDVLEFFTAVMSPDTRFVACRAIEAELAKYMENAYFAAKIAFCAEFAEIATRLGIDYKQLRELWLLDPRIEPDHTVIHRDKPYFDGKCLPKDLDAIIAAAQKAGSPMKLLEAVKRANENKK